MTLTRRNAYNNGGTFDNPDLLWYAKAVGVMKSRPITDPTSWWFYAAIHGEFITPENMKNNTRRPYLNWPNLSPSYIPASAIVTIPNSGITDKFWNQCQHSTWYFGPWHRGYLAAIEIILRNIIVDELNGPKDWSLPYWNYMKLPENNLPPAFSNPQLDNSPNPLFVPQRYGKMVDVGKGENDANDVCQLEHDFTSYAGGITNPLFAHFGNASGDLEQNPHNYVHGMVGGQKKVGLVSHSGIMGAVPAAALDPIFYLHHANIDRMLSAWIVTGKNNYTNDPDWLNGPTSDDGKSRFVMPMENNKVWYFTPSDVLDTTKVQYMGQAYGYTYDDLSLTSYTQKPSMTFNENLTARLAKLGIEVDGQNLDIKMATKKNPELVGASSGLLSLNSGMTETTAQLDKRTWKSVERSFLDSSSTNIPNEIYLQLEGVKGVHETNFLSVYVNQVFIKSVSLFGIDLASNEKNPHGGDGLTFRFNITSIVDDLHLEQNFDIDALKIQIKTKHDIDEGDEITVGRIAIYRIDQ